MTHLQNTDLQNITSYKKNKLRQDRKLYNKARRFH